MVDINPVETKTVYDSGKVSITACYYKGEFEYYRVTRRHDGYEKACLFLHSAQRMARLMEKFPNSNIFITTTEDNIKDE